jgi:DNA-binding response OmpR family regulator
MISRPEPSGADLKSSDSQSEIFPESSVQKWKILLVDDEEDFLSALAERLSLRGIVPLTATGEEQAFALIENTAPHLVVLDVDLGPDIVRRLAVQYPEVPVIVLTDIGQYLPGQEGLRLGARCCLMNPFQIEELLNAIKECLGITSLDSA